MTDAEQRALARLNAELHARALRLIILAGLVGGVAGAFMFGTLLLLVGF